MALRFVPPSAAPFPKQRLVGKTPQNHKLVDWGNFPHRDDEKGDFKIAACALKGLGYVQAEKRINGRKARWWSKTTPNKEMSHVS